MSKRLLLFAAVVEGIVGLALVLVPAMVIAFLLDVEPHDEALMIGRVGGVALFALGVACAAGAADVGSTARAGTLAAITSYNAGAGLLFVVFAATAEASGLVVWLAGVFHLTLAAAFGVSVLVDAPAPWRRPTRTP